MPDRADRWRAGARRSALRLLPFVGFAGVVGGFALGAPSFWSFGNLANVVAQSAILGILALGLTAVVIAGGANVLTGGIDLSLAANLGLGAAVYASADQQGCGDLVAMALTLLSGWTVGLLNGTAVVWLRLPPLLATLATMDLVAGLELVLTQNTVLPVSSSFLQALAGNGLAGMPNLAWLFAAVSLVAVLCMQHTAWGLRMYAVGEFTEAARACGLSVKGHVFASYLISGTCAGIAAIASVAFFNGSTTGSGELLLPVIAIAFLGVVFSRRLTPTMSGTLIASLFIGVLINGFQLLNLSIFWVNGIQGLLIMAVVALSALSSRGAR